MRAIISRIRRLENAAAPAEQEWAAVAAINEARRRRLGADLKPIAFPPGTFDGCRTSEERIIRGRVAIMMMKQEAARRTQEVGLGATSKQRWHSENDWHKYT